MVKRKDPSTPYFPSTVHLQPAIRDASNAQSSGPFVAYFASGYCPDKIEKLSFEVYKHVDRPREHCLVVEKDGVAFVGSTADAEGPPSCRFAVGLLDKASGVMKYAEVNGGIIVRMEPRAHGTAYGPTGHRTEHEETPQARRAQNERLVKAFGSTRRQRTMKERALAQVVGEHVEAAEAVKEILDVVGTKAAQANATKDEILQAATGARHIPQHHPEAMTASQAYRLEELVPPGAWDALQDVSSLERAIEDVEYRENELRAEHRVPDYVLDRLAVITQPRSQTGARRLRALAFLAALCQLYMGRRDLQLREGLPSLARRLKIQADVLQPLLEAFYNLVEEEGRQKYSRTKEQQRFMLLHLLMTALIAEEYNMGGRQFEALRVYLKIEAKEVVKYYREMGCSVDADRSAGPASPSKQYRVRLLPEGLPGMPAKTLADTFPKLAVPRERKR